MSASDSGSLMRPDQDEDDAAPAPEPEPTRDLLPPPVKRRSRLARLARFTVYSVLILALLTTLTLWMVTRSWFIIWQVRPELEKKLGGEVTIGRADYDGGGRVIFRDVTLRVRGLTGEAGEVAHIRRCLVNVGLARLLKGDVQLQDVEISDATMRLSESAAEPGSMNIQLLRPEREQTGKPLPALPRVQIRNLALEVGTHDDAGFSVTGRRRLAGEMEPIVGQEGWLVFDLREVDERGRGLGEEGLLIKGEWNSRTLEASSRIEGIALDERIHSMLPLQAQQAWNQMNLQGHVSDVRIDWQSDAPLTVQFSVKDVALTLPVDLQEMWSLYRNGAVEETTGRPRMNVHSGQIRVSTNSLALDGLTGEVLSVLPGGDVENVVGVPYQISLSVPVLPQIEWDDPERWMEEALKTAPFEADLIMEDFSLRNEEAETKAVGLPTIVARTLAKFQTTGWVLSTTVHVRRGEPVKDANGVLQPGKLAMTGQAYVNRATGKYHKFPYLMEDVYAYLHFNNERVVVEYLNARGSNGASFQIKGVIEPPDKDASFRMQVKGLNVPLDDRFRAALKPNELKAFDAMFSHASAESMAAGGLLPDAVVLKKQQAERNDAAARLSEMKRSENADAQAIEALQQHIAHLDRSIAAGPFVTGGAVNIDLVVTRDLGPQKPTTVGGSITLQTGGLIFDRFPYPLRITGGKLKWANDEVSIDPGPAGAGLTFITPAGGLGSVTGGVAFPKIEGDRKIRPDLTFVIEDDPANEAVYAAIPVSKKELAEAPELERDWPGKTKSRAGRMVQGIGLSGDFDYHGRINTREDGKMTWDFRVSLDEGRAAPDMLLAREINARDLPWPAGFAFDNLKGAVRVRREGVSWEQISGISGETTLNTSGLIDLRDVGEPDFVTIRLSDAPIDRSALNMIPADGAARAEALWDRYQPQGRFDATISYRTDAPPAQSASVTLEPRQVSVVLGDERMMLRGREGAVHIDREHVAFDNLAFDLVRLAAPREAGGGALSLRGAWMFGRDEPSFDIAGEWLGGRFELPVIPAMLQVFGQEDEAKRYASFDPSGDFDMSYRISRPRPEAPPEYRFAIQPQAIDFTLRGKDVTLALDSGGVTITPGSISIEEARGRIGDEAAGGENGAGGRFSVDGHVSTGAVLDARLSLEYAGTFTNNQIAAFLPTTVTDALTALEFSDNDESRLEGGLLHVRRSESAEEGADAGWQTEFTGRLVTKGASFVAGLQFSDVDGWIDLDVKHETGRPPRLNALCRASRASVLGQPLTDLEAPMSLNEAGDVLLIPAAQARSGDGAVSASAECGVGERREYEVRLDVVGMPLGNLLTGGSDPAMAASQSTATDDRTDPVTGQVYASLSLSGLRGDVSSKRGRGMFRVLEGNLSHIPLLLQAVQVMQLTLPLSGTIDYADSEAYIVGDTAHFERILFESTVGSSAALQLIGEGTLELETMEVAARFRSRSGVAILRDIIGGIGDMLYEIEITGPLRDPKARVVPLP